MGVDKKNRLSFKYIQRSIKRKTLSMLPKPIRFHLMRKMITTKSSISEDFTFKIAESKEEFESAYRILHDNYVDSGFMKPNSSNMRITKYFMLPSTTTLIILRKDQVIGTMSIVRKTKLGLPLEESFDISPFISADEVVAEVSSLAIDKNFSRGRADLFFPICKFFNEFIINYMGIQKVFIAVNPNMADFYEGFLLFDPITSKVKDNYDFANGAPAVCLCGDLSKIYNRMKEVYGSMPSHQNLFRYFWELKLENFNFPTRLFHKSMDPNMTPEMIRYFFVEKSSVLFDLKPEDRNYVAQLYPKSLVNQISELNHEPLLNIKNRHDRFLSTINCKIANINMKVFDLSLRGLKIGGYANLKENDEVNIDMEIAQNRVITITGRVIWQNSKLDQFGITLYKHQSKSWTEYVKAIENDFMKNIDSSISKPIYILKSKYI